MDGSLTPADLHERRRALGATQAQLGALLGVAGNTVARWERGEQSIGNPTLVRLALDRLAQARRDLPQVDAPRRLGARRTSASARQIRHNLPQALTGLVGRQAETAEIQRLLIETRLLSLVGAGGVGKTRLALEPARALLGTFPDGVWLVELAPLADPALLPDAVASVLGAREQPGRPVLETLMDQLVSSRLLLVLDNCEHLVAACAELAERLLRACPALRILATSREPLRVVGEVAWRVPSLSHPQAGCLPAADELRRYAAVRLFAERARSVMPGFAVTDGNAAAVARICRQLDGIPLALELAAARLGILGVEQLAERLDDRFRLLTTGSRTALPRHRTLRAAVGWSYELLDGPERWLFRRLAVFAGGWALEASEAICASESVKPGEMLDLLGQLVDKSLVIADRAADGAMRYRLLETLREYAAERLRSSGEETVLRTRHLDWFATFAERTATLLSGPQQPEAFARLEVEHDNLRVALDWSRSREGGWEVGARLAESLVWFWLLRGHRREGEEWLAQLLPATPQGTAARARVLLAAGVVAQQGGDLGRASACLEQGLTLWRKLGDKRGVALALARLGQLRQALGDYESAWALLQESAARFRDLGGESGLDAPLVIFLAQVAKQRGDYERAIPLFAESLALSRERGDRHAAAGALRSLGELQQLRGDHERATALLKENLVLLREIEDKPCTAITLERLADVASAQERPERAARLFGAAARLRQAINVPLSSSEHPGYERSLAAVRTKMGAHGFEATWAAGAAMSSEAAIEYALGAAASLAQLATAPGPADGREQPLPEPLSARELEVLRLMATGATNQQVAEHLVVAVTTVKTHVNAIFRKLEVASRIEAVTRARDLGLFDR